MNKFTISLLRYTDEVYDKLMNDLNYYMLRCKATDEQLYYVMLKKDLIILYGNNNWTLDALNVLIRNSFRNDGTHIIFPYTYHRGYLDTSKIEKMSRSDDFFKETKKYRKIINEEMNLKIRKLKLNKIVNNIDEK